MPGASLVQIGATIVCPHAGQASVVASNARVLLSGAPAATAADQCLVAGCAFTVPPGKPQPCVTVRWLAPATRILIGGQPALLQSSAGIAQSAEQIPQGPPTVVTAQPRAKGM